MGNKNSNILVINGTNQRTYVSSPHSAESGTLYQGQHILMGIGPDGQKLVQIKCFDHKNREIKSIEFWCWCDDDWIIKKNGIQQLYEGTAQENPNGCFHPWGVDNEAHFQREDELEEERQREQEAARQMEMAKMRLEEEEQMRALVTQQNIELEQLRQDQEARSQKEAEEMRKEEIRQNIENAKKESTSQKNEEWAEQERKREEEEELNEFAEMNRKHVGGRGGTSLPFDRENEAAKSSEFLLNLKAQIASSVPSESQEQVEIEISAQLQNPTSLGLNNSSPDIHIICLETLANAILKLTNFHETCTIANFLLPNLDLLSRNEGKTFQDLTDRASSLLETLENAVTAGFGALSGEKLITLFSGRFTNFSPFLINLVISKAEVNEDKEEGFLLIKALAFSTPTMGEEHFLRIFQFVCSTPFPEDKPEARIDFLEMFSTVIPDLTKVENRADFEEHYPFVLKLFNPVENEDNLERYAKSQIVNKLAEFGWFSERPCDPAFIEMLNSSYENVASLEVALASHLISLLSQTYNTEQSSFHYKVSQVLAQFLKDEVALEVVLSSDSKLGTILVNKTLEIQEKDFEESFNIKRNLVTLLGKCPSFIKCGFKEGLLEKVLEHLEKIEPDNREFPIIFQLAMHLGSVDEVGNRAENSSSLSMEVRFVLLELVQKGYQLGEKTLRVLLQDVVKGDLGWDMVNRRLLIGSLHHYPVLEKDTTALANQFLEKVKFLGDEGEWELVGEILAGITVRDDLVQKVLEMVGF